jgi:UDP-3-O-[3-hydroxymyristoyl] glucosamine N-acyltransferase
MKLSELVNQYDELVLIREGEFDHFEVLGGKVSKTLKLSYCESVDFVRKVLQRNDIVCLITHPLLVNEFPQSMGILVSDNPKEFFYFAHNLRVKEMTKIDSTIDNTSIISSKATISSHNVVIGRNCIIDDNVIVYPNTLIGNNVIIKSGSIIGKEPFYYYKNSNKLTRVYSSGQTVIYDNVEIENNVIIENSVFEGKTTIGDSCKINSNVFIGHDASIMDETILLNGSSIGARAQIGENSWIGINSTIANSVEIGKNTRVNICSVVVSNTAENSVVSGHYAINHMEFIANQIKSRRKN